MKFMTGLCFVDANVLVYSRDQRDLRKREVAGALLARLWQEQVGRISMQALNEFYSAVTRKASPAVSQEVAWSVVEQFLTWHPQPIDSALLRQARTVEARYKLNWWDALIVAAAQLQNCSTLYSEDMQNGALFGSVCVRNPFIAQVQEEPPVEYVPKVVSRHRPRGRPRKAA
jgi:predicted nucleic acid-binding protein